LAAIKIRNKLERKKSTHSQEFIYRTKYFRDDIESLIDELLGIELEVEISDSDNIYESLDEVIENRGHFVSELNINSRVSNSSFSRCDISISKSRTFLSVSGDEDLLNFGHKIHKMLLDRKVSWLNVITRRSYFPFYLIVYFLALLNAWGGSLKGEYTLLWTPWLISLTVICLAWLGSLVNPYSDTRIYLKRKHDVDFFENNKEKLILIIVSALVGTIITLIVQMI
jgi:hypothetical protein